MTEVARLLLAAVLAVAGVAKLLDPEGSRRAARAFGAPGWLGVVLPVVELGIAVALVPSSTARAAAVAGAALLVVFGVAIANALLRGRKPDCGCLGRLYSKPAGWGTVARNAALAAVALVVAAQPAGVLSWLELAVAGAVVVLATQAILAYALLRRYGRALARIEAIETSREAPAASPVPEAGNGSARLALAGAAAGAVAATAAVAQAAPRRPSALDPELKAIEDALRAGGPKLVAAARRSLNAYRAQMTLRKGKDVRKKRLAAKRALAAERREVLALRAKIDRLPGTSADANNVKVMVRMGLTLLAQSLEKRERAIGSTPKDARRRTADSQELFVRSLSSFAGAAKVIGEGQ